LEFIVPPINQALYRDSILKINRYIDNGKNRISRMVYLVHPAGIADPANPVHILVAGFLRIAFPRFGGGGGCEQLASVIVEGESVFHHDGGKAEVNVWIPGPVVRQMGRRLI
jgi:hypothetical protein